MLAETPWGYPVTAQLCRAWLPVPEPQPSLRVLVANPLARGADREAVSRTAELLGLAGRAIREVGRDGTARALAAEAVRAGAQCVVAAGGDGTVHQVVQETAGSACVLAVIPLGTSNDLALRAGIPRDLEAACAVAWNGATDTLDVLTLGETRIATVGGFGFPAHVARACNALRAGAARSLARLLGRGVYTAVSAAKILVEGVRTTPVALGLGTGAPIVRPVSAVLVGVVPRFGGGLALVPGGTVTPGTFAALLVTAPTRRRLLGVLARLKAGRRTGRHARLITDLASLELRAADPVGSFGDGEWLGFRRRVRVAIERNALRMMVPHARASARRAQAPSGEAG
jgi:diacylglycerol kinase family enzyme